MNGRTLLYLDSCVFIAAIEETTPNAAPARKLLGALAAQPGVAMTSELTLAELLAPSKYASMSIADRRDIYLRLFDEGKFIRLAPISRKLLLDTSVIREVHPQRMPDAIHIATAVDAGCQFFMTYDRDARRLPSTLNWLTPSEGDVDQLLKALDA